MGTTPPPGEGGGTYITGHYPADNEFAFHDFFVFSLNGVTSPITGATLSIYNPYDGFYGDPADFTVHDANSLLTAITSGVSSVATYNGLGAGTVLGSTHVDSSVNSLHYSDGQYSGGSFVDVTLNPFAIAVLNQLEGQTFAVGGTVGGPGNATALPLPSDLPLFLLALGELFAVAQFKKQRIAA